MSLQSPEGSQSREAAPTLENMRKVRQYQMILSDASKSGETQDFPAGGSVKKLAETAERDAIGFRVFDRLVGETLYEGERVEMMSAPRDVRTFYVDAKKMSVGEGAQHFAKIDTMAAHVLMNKLYNLGEGHKVKAVVIARDGETVILDEESAQVISSQPADQPIVELIQDPLVEIE